MMLVAASHGIRNRVGFGPRRDRSRLEELFNVPQPIRLLWVVPIGRARFWPGLPNRAEKSPDFTHYESHELNKMRDKS